MSVLPRRVWFLMTDYIADAIMKTVKEDLGVDVFVAKYVVVMDAVLPDGKRMLSRLPSEDASAWDVHGMLTLVAADVAADFIDATFEGLPDGEI